MVGVGVGSGIGEVFDLVYPLYETDVRDQRSLVPKIYHQRVEGRVKRFNTPGRQ